MTPTSTEQNSRQDHDAVAAVRHGDAERYRELVERHERRVFAVAWSRLGDAGLAEEATQEAFIRGYRRLWLLGDGAKFAGWIISIARNAAINLGVRHRRELNKRERWALENTEPATTSSENTVEPHSPETLRQTLEELPAAHRECLVLFYLEGKSGAEAAAVLGISESAFRVRLHRARGALRAQLEEKLAGSLEKLRPAMTLVPGIMAVILASSSSAKAAAVSGVGAAITGALAKFTPLKWVFPFFSLIGVLPILFFSWLFTRLELVNFRDQDGFRARIFRETVSRQILWMIPLLVGLWWGMPLLRSTDGLRTFYLALAVFLLVLTVISARLLAINRNRYFVSLVVSPVVLLAGLLAIGLNWLPQSLITVFILAQSLLTMRGFGERPIRMDYNLFLRAAEGMLAAIPEHSSPTVRTTRRSKTELLAFARFLGSRWLVNNYRWIHRGLALRLPPVKSSAWGILEYFGGWSRGSRITLGDDGTVSAQLADRDRRALARLQKRELPSPGELETQVDRKSVV